MKKLTPRGCIWMAALSLLMAAAVSAGILYHSRQVYVKRQLFLIGEIEELHPEWTREYLQLLYKEKTKESVCRKGQEALETYAYTGQGIVILADRMLPVGNTVLMAGAGLFFLLLTVCFVFLRLKLDREECVRLREQLFLKKQEADRLADARDRTEKVKKFIENIAHQVKTPLSRAMTSLELLNSQLSVSSQTERAAECIRHLEEIRTLVTQLLEIGRMEMGAVLFHYDLFLIKDLLADVSSLTDQKKTVKITIEPAKSDTVWSGDYRWMKEAIRNLLENALEHNTSEEPVEISCTEETEYYKLTIRDHGRGLKEADLDFLFDRFYVPSEEKKGHTGIGLNLAKLIIDGHHGTIHAGNHPGGGACFTICLPKYRVMKNAAVTIS